jgi:hypothetical protein
MIYSSPLSNWKPSIVGEVQSWRKGCDDRFTLALEADGVPNAFSQMYIEVTNHKASVGTPDTSLDAALSVSWRIPSLANA